MLHKFLGRILCLVSCSMVLTCWLGSVTSESVPSLFVRGSYQTVGHSIGQTFRDGITQYLAHHPSLRPVWLPWSKTPAGHKVVADLQSAASTHFPQYVEELRAMALGANVSYLELFLSNHYVEISALLGPHSKAPESCSDLYVNHHEEGRVFLAHNEDNLPLIQDSAYFVSAVVTDDSGHHVLENFTAYCYPGILAGNAFGFNSHGVVLTLNALFPTSVNTARVGRNFMTRALLAARDLDDILVVAKTVSAYGFSVNVGILPDGKSVSNKPELYNIEIAPAPVPLANRVSVYPVLSSITAGPESSSPGNYFHVNMYRRLNVSQIPAHVVSSIHRTARIQQFSPAPSSARDLRDVLGDTKDPLYPIYRTPRASDPEVTLATALFDLLKCTLTVYLDNPKYSSGPVTIMNLPCQISGLE